jgi:hypothetical protein
MNVYIIILQNISIAYSDTYYNMLNPKVPQEYPIRLGR